MQTSNKMQRAGKVLALGTSLLFSSFASAGLMINTPVDVIGNLSAASFAANGYGTQAYKDWGNEPFIAVNPLDPTEMVISSFSYGTSSTATGANIFYSTTGGASWTSQFSMPAPANGTNVPRDWTFSYDMNGLLHATVLGSSAGSLNIYHGTTNDPTSLAAWNWTGGGARINSGGVNNADQPWMAVQGGTVFVGYDDFSAGTAIRVAASTDNGATFSIDNAITNAPSATNTVNPGTRIATDGNGNVYSIFGLGTNISQGKHNVTYYLNRSQDNGATWDFAGASAVGGIVIGSGASQQLCNCTQASNTWFAGVNDLRGNITSIAADATGAHVYALIGKQDGAGVDRIYLVEFHDDGFGGLVASPETVVSVPGQRAALPNITVLDNGTVVIMYDSYDSATNMVNVHIATSTDFGATIDSDVVSYSFVPLTLIQATGSANANREFGDYQFLTSIGNDFYGTFAGLGNVNGGGINTTGLIDPFFISGSVNVPEPATLPLMLAALLSFAYFRRRASGGASARLQPGK